MHPDQRIALILLALTVAFLLLDGHAYVTRSWWHTPKD